MPGKTSTGSWDIFAWRFSPAGEELWTYQSGTPLSDGGLAVAVDPAGNIILSGHTEGNLSDQTNAGLDDAYVRKLSPTGDELWTREFGSPNPDWAFGVAVDGSGNIIAVGAADGPLPGQTSIGYEDTFVRKYSPEGLELWTRQFGSTGSCRAFGVAVDGSGNIIVVGRTEGALPGQTNLGTYDVFVRKYGRDGAELWTRQFGTTWPDLATAVAVDASGDILVAGTTEGALPGQTQVGSGEAFVRKYNPDGAELWTRQFGTALSDEALAVATDAAGDVYVAGVTTGVFPGQTRAGHDDAFVRKYSAAGAELWTCQFGSPAWNVAFGVAVDKRGAVFVCGATDGPMPGQNWAGDWDAYVVRIDQPSTP
jgi:hypothetical protein